LASVVGITIPVEHRDLSAQGSLQHSRFASKPGFWTLVPPRRNGLGSFATGNSACLSNLHTSVDPGLQDLIEEHIGMSRFERAGFVEFLP